MPKGPKGEKRPADVIGTAITVAKIATGEVEDDTGDDGKDPAAVKRGLARALKLSPEERSRIAKKAAASRWGSDGFEK